MKIDKRSGILCCILCLVFTVSWGQKNIKGTGYILTQQRNIDDFTSIEVSRGIDVAIVQGEMQPITVEADDNLFPFIKTTVRNKTLKIYIPDTVNIIKYAVMNVLISMPKLCDLKASNNSHIDASPQMWEVHNLTLESSTGGQIRIHLKANEIKAEARTSGFIKLRGKSQRLNADLKTAAHLEAREFMTEDATLQLSTGAKAEIQVNRNLTYDLCGHSRLSLRGNPHIANSHICSGSQITKEK